MTRANVGENGDDGGRGEFHSDDNRPATINDKRANRSTVGASCAQVLSFIAADLIDADLPVRPSAENDDLTPAENDKHGRSLFTYCWNAQCDRARRTTCTGDKRSRDLLW